MNFYGNLIIDSDKKLLRITEALHEHGMLDNTLIIVTSDHGEMGMTHCGQRQKNFNFYEETLRVPLVYSNPKLFPKPAVSHAMVPTSTFCPHSPACSMPRNRRARVGKVSTTPALS